jgi:biopolymer transport protein ExbD
MAYQRKRNKGETPKLDMTPMIDVVFQLLIFFVVTLKQEDILQADRRPSCARSQRQQRESD